MNGLKYLILATGCLMIVAGAMGCGSLNPKTEGQIYSALEAQKEEFQKCYENALKTNRNQKGDVELKLKFEPKSKRPKETAVAKSDINDPEMMKCVSKAADRIRIEDAPGVFVDGQYTLNFEYRE
jgi:hypothetical protein